MDIRQLQGFSMRSPALLTWGYYVEKDGNEWQNWNVNCIVWKNQWRLHVSSIQAGDARTAVVETLKLISGEIEKI